MRQIARKAFCKSLFIVSNSSSIQIGTVMTFCPPRVFLGLRALEHFGLKNQTRKIVKIHKNFELQQVFMYKFLC